MSLELAATVAERSLKVDLSIASGETVALLGPNGAGKSSVLAIAAGLLRPDAGRVVLNGRVLLSTSEHIDLAPHRRAVALLAQDPLLFPHLSVRENVAFGPRSQGIGRAASRQRADEALESVDLVGLDDRRPHQVSGGQAQRAAVARALAADPQLLLLDEPLAAVDIAAKPALRQTLRRVLAERTAVIVTHDVLDALLIADRVVVLDHGRVVEDGPGREVLSRPRSAFAAQLAGLNLLTGTWRGDHVALTDGTTVRGIVTGPAPTVGDAVVATFRPSAVAIYTDPRSGSPRNSFPVTVSEIEPLGELYRARAGQLSADVTAHAVADLELAPGSSVRFSVKATEVAIYGL